MELQDKIRFMQNNYAKAVAGDSTASDSLSFDMTYSFPTISDYILSSTKLLNAYCDGVEKDPQNLSAFYVEACKLLERQAKASAFVE